MRRIQIILSFILLGILILTCSKEESPVVPAPPNNEIMKGTIKGKLKGDGRLLQNNSYEGIAIELYKDGTLYNTDTSGVSGEFSFADLDTGKYEIKSTLNFIYDNVAYADEYFTINDTLIEKDLLFDSLKYDLCPIKIGNTYTFLTRDIWSCTNGRDVIESIIKIEIKSSQQIGDTIFYYFSGDQDYLDSGALNCYYSKPDSHYVLNGFFRDFNNQVRCIISSSGGRELSFCFRGIHLYDESSELIQFLEVFNDARLTIENGILFEVNGEQYETLRLNYYFPMNGSTDKTYNFSYQLGTVYSRSWHYGGNSGAWGPEITLIDFTFSIP